MTASSVARVVVIAALILNGLTGLLASGFSPLAIAFILWSLLPFGMLWIAARVITNPWVIGGAGAAALTVEAGIRAGVFLYPRGSTAAIALVFSPLWIAIIALPAGALLGWAMGYVFTRTGVAVRAASTVAALAALALAFIAFARPELLPTAVIKRQQALEVIGEPRIVMGGDRYTRVLVRNVSAWLMPGEFDGQPGDELAIVDHQGAEVIDATSLERKLFIPFEGERRVNWRGTSRLLRTGSGFVVAQTGGGYSTTEVVNLDGSPRWSFAPDPKLPPTAMLPADLDRDGEVEFYASATKEVTRLDADGAKVWSRDATLSHIVAVRPRDRGQPSWVVATRHGAGIDIWNDAGDRIANLPWPDGRVHGVVEWPSERVVIVGDRSIRGVSADGANRFDIPIEPTMSLTQVAAWKPDAGSPPLLAVVAGGDRYVRRWRLLIYQAQQPVYDEVFDAVPQLHAVERAGGAATLFVVVDGALWQMRSVHLSR